MRTAAKANSKKQLAEDSRRFLLWTTCRSCQPNDPKLNYRAAQPGIRAAPGGGGGGKEGRLSKSSRAKPRYRPGSSVWNSKNTGQNRSLPDQLKITAVT